MSKIHNIKECPECKINKGWGHELIIYNSEKYCGKLLVFKAGCKFSMHYHLLKQETWYVNKGEFKYHWIDTAKGIEHTNYLKVGDVVTQYPGMPHQLEAIEDGEIFEVSTQHFDSDSYRVRLGD
jgi:quercetin dioxygenase-like cupin family protein